MKAIRIAVLGLALALTSTVASAQGGGGGGRGAGRGNPMMTGITLSEEQQAKVTEINTKYAAERPDRALMQSDRAAFMKKQADFTAKVNPEIRAILTPDQQAVWDKNAAVAKVRADSMAKANPAL
jgi:Spy/CpxP family protein refolding chaperone